MNSSSTAHNSRIQADERKNMKTINGNICVACISNKLIPDSIMLVSSILREFPSIEYTDTQLNNHKHDMNVLVNTYQCSERHVWITNISMNKCWCIPEKININPPINPPRFDYLRHSPIAKIFPLK